MKKTIKVFLIIVFLAFLVIIFLHLYFDNIFSGKSIRFEDIKRLEENIKSEYSISSLEVIANRGMYCYFNVYLDQEGEESLYQEIRQMILQSLQSGLRHEIIVYCTENYTSDFIPGIDNFELNIHINGRVQYYDSLLF